MHVYAWRSLIKVFTRRALEASIRAAGAPVKCTSPMCKAGSTRAYYYPGREYRAESSKFAECFSVLLSVNVLFKRFVVGKYLTPADRTLLASIKRISAE